jgi:hypothetical protein
MNYTTPPELAKRWHIKPAKVITEIKAGRLTGFTTSPPGCSRPRWLISEEAVREYERARQAKPAERPTRRRRVASGRDWF